MNGPSTDGTHEMLRAFEDEIRLADCSDASLGRSRNIGVECAGGEIVAFIDDDAIPRADWLEKLITPYRDERLRVTAGASRLDAGGSRRCCLSRPVEN